MNRKKTNYEFSRRAASLKLWLDRNRDRRYFGISALSESWFDRDPALLNDVEGRRRWPAAGKRGLRSCPVMEDDDEMGPICDLSAQEDRCRRWPTIESHVGSQRGADHGGPRGGRSMMLDRSMLP